jgi:hypothetical protein
MGAVATVEKVVEDLAANGAEGFHASYVAREADVPTGDARSRLARLVDSGDLQENFELVCPSCGRTIATFRRGDRLPLGELHPCGICGAEPFVVSEADFVISYTPTQSFLSKLLRDGRAKGRGRATKKAFRRLMKTRSRRRAPRTT